MSWQDYFHDDWAPPTAVTQLVERGEAYDVTAQGDAGPSFLMGDDEKTFARFHVRYPGPTRPNARVSRFMVRVTVRFVDLRVVDTDSASEAVAAWRAAGRFPREDDTPRKATKHLVPSSRVADVVRIPFDVAVWRAEHPEHDLCLRTKNGYVVACPPDFRGPGDLVASNDDRNLVFFKAEGGP